MPHVINTAGTPGSAVTLASLPVGALFINPSQPGKVYEVCQGVGYAPPSGFVMVKNDEGQVSNMGVNEQVNPVVGVLRLI